MPLRSIIAAAAALLGRPVIAASPVKAGGNNRVYRIETAEGPFALKTYVQDPGDDRDRLGTEFGALAFLGCHSITCVPEAVSRDADRGIGIYGWIDGTPVDGPGKEDVDSAVGFVQSLARLSTADGAGALRSASEACLSAAELTRQLTHRHERLAAVGDPALDTFLADTLGPAIAGIGARARTAFVTAGMDFDVELAPALRILSQSDFGFHNAIRTDDGLAFIDFEYFGHDDPVKLTSDFLLHPGFVLEADEKRRFALAMHDLFADDTAFAHRLRILFPLYALRWALIVLNPFLPGWQASRAGSGDIRRQRAERLQRAKDMVTTAQMSEGNFPYE